MQKLSAVDLILIDNILWKQDNILEARLNKNPIFG